MEQVAFEKAIWDAFCQCFLSFDEACDAIWRHKNGMLIDMHEKLSRRAEIEGMNREEFLQLVK